jgi:hypothetical protein
MKRNKKDIESKTKKSGVDVLDTAMHEFFKHGTEREKAEAIECCANFIATCTPGTDAGGG